MKEQAMWQFQQEDENTVSSRYLTFLIDGQIFGMSIKEVIQIVGMQEITQLPDHPTYVKGVISLREDIIPVIDVRTRFDRPQIQYTDRTCIIITTLPEGSYGFIVDEVDEVCDILPEQITPPPRIKSEGSTCSYFKGIAQVSESQGKKGKTVLLIVVSELLEEHEFSSLAQVAKADGR